MKVIKIGTRGSKLALVQARQVASKLADMGYKSEFIIIATSGDLKSGPLCLLGGKGLFVTEIERFLLDRRIDIAVHSMKDIPARVSSEFYINCFMKRGDPRDALFLSSRVMESSAGIYEEIVQRNAQKHEDIIKKINDDGVKGRKSSKKFTNDPYISKFHLGDVKSDDFCKGSEQSDKLRDILRILPEGSKVGTCSVRRKMLLLKARPDLQIMNLRGNIPTRINKMRDGDFDAIMLANAGLIRADIQTEGGERIMPLDIDTFMPAVGQGTVLAECLASDSDMVGLLDKLCDDENRIIGHVERGFIETIDGECSTATGCYSWLSDDGATNVYAMLADNDSVNVAYSYARMSGTNLARAQEMGKSAAQALLSKI